MHTLCSQVTFIMLANFEIHTTRTRVHVRVCLLAIQHACASFDHRELGSTVYHPALVRIDREDRPERLKHCELSVCEHCLLVVFFIHTCSHLVLVSGHMVAVAYTYTRAHLLL